MALLRNISGWARDHGHLVALVGVFVVSRAFLLWLGVEFHVDRVDALRQVLDREVLRQRLLESLLYLHIQPPLFNLFLGVVGKLPAANEAWVFQAIFRGLGLVMALAMFFNLCLFGVRRGTSLAIVSACLISPQWILYESWLFYEFPTAVFLLLAALLWHRYVTKCRLVDGVGLFIAIASIVLLRSVFHLGWMLLLVAGLLWWRPRHWRRTMCASLIPLLLCLSWYSKNLWLFGTFSATSWTGLSFAKKTTFLLPLEERRQLVQERRLSRLSLSKPFTSEREFERVAARYASTGIPVLDSFRKSSGQVNLNHIVFIGIGRAYASDALAALSYSPSTFLGGVGRSFQITFRSSTDYVAVVRNRRLLRTYDGLVNVVLGRWSATGGTLWVVLVIYIVVIAQGFRRLPTTVQHRGTADPRLLGRAFLWFNVLYILAVSCTFEIGENQRFRVLADPLVVILVGLSLDGWLISLGRRQTRSIPGVEEPGRCG